MAASNAESRRRYQALRAVGFSYEEAQKFKRRKKETVEEMVNVKKIYNVIAKDPFAPTNVYLWNMAYTLYNEGETPDSLHRYFMYLLRVNFDFMDLLNDKQRGE